MRHVDEGTIHAWLDAQVTDAAEAAWVSAHLRACAPCRARVDEERATRDQAAALLALALPGADAVRPPFEAIVARAAGSDGQAAAPLRGTRLRTWAIPVGWAASVALAVGIGWMARDLSERRPESRTTVRSASPALAANEPDRSIASVGAIRSAAQPAREPAPHGGGTAAAKPHAAPRVERPAPPSIETSRPEPSDDPAIRAPLPSASPVLPLSNPGAPVLSPPVSADLAATPLYQGRTESTFPSPQFIESPGTPQFGRVPVRGEVGTVPGGAARSAAPVAARGTNRPLTGNLFAGSSPALFGSAATADGSSWRVLPRTEAAARSGMALYGIAGLTPVVTTLSPDNAIVRTLYRLESGENIEVMQQKVEYFANPAASSALVSALAQPAKEAASPDGPPAWSVLRDNVRVTLRGAARPEALSERLRLD